MYERHVPGMAHTVLVEQEGVFSEIKVALGVILEAVPDISKHLTEQLEPAGGLCAVQVQRDASCELALEECTILYHVC